MPKAKLDTKLINSVMRSGAILAGTILVGAIGSGVWETLLSPILTSLSRGFLSFLSSISSAYADVLHSRIATDTTDTYSQAPFAAVAALMLILPLFLVNLIFILLRFLSLKKHISALLNDPEQLPSAADSNRSRSSGVTKALNVMGDFRRTTLWVSILLAAGLVLGGLYVFIRAKYTRQAAVYVERSLAILAPSLSDKERLQLYADYRAIESAVAFYKLHETLQSLGTTKGVKLPTFEPVGYK